MGVWGTKINEGREVVKEGQRGKKMGKNRLEMASLVGRFEF